MKHVTLPRGLKPIDPGVWFDITFKYFEGKYLLSLACRNEPNPHVLMFAELTPDDLTALRGWLDEVAPEKLKMDPTAVAADDMIEQLKQQFPQTTFHHPV